MTSTSICIIFQNQLIRFRRRQARDEPGLSVAVFRNGNHVLVEFGADIEGIGLVVLEGKVFNDQEDNGMVVLGTQLRVMGKGREGDRR